MSFKSFDLANDVASVVSSINEVVSISSSIYANNANIKFFNNISSTAVNLGGYWQSVYDSSPTSSFSTALLDMTYGYSSGSTLNILQADTSSQNEKIKIYRHFASQLLGNSDSLFTINNAEQKECFFIMIKRNIQKDEIKKGSTSIIINRPELAGGVYTNSYITASDDGAATTFKQTIGGDYAPLKYFGTGSEIGQMWFNAGVIVIPSTLVWGVLTPWSGTADPAAVPPVVPDTINKSQTTRIIDNVIDGLRLHVEKISFHNQTNLYSTIYFCRANNSEFNYSSNPTFVDDNKRIRVTSGSNILQTRTYITTIGLYDANDNLLAVAKVNKPITKSPDNEAIFRIRLDY